MPVQTTDTANVLIANTYTVIVTDSLGCDTTEIIVITEPAILTATISSVTQVSCKGAGDGQATVTAAGGTTAYTYSWNTVPVQTNATATGLVPGTYIVTLTDNQGCDTTDSVTITEPDTFVATITTVNHVSCNGADDGLATVTVTGGTGMVVHE